MRTPAAKAGRRDWIGLAVIAIPCLIYSMDLTVLYLAVPQIVADLKPSAAELLWIVDIYGFMVAGALVTMGTLGDRIGRRKVLLIGAAAFGITSVLAAYSTSTEMLIVARALQGLAAATLAPSTLSLIRNMFLDAAGARVRHRHLGGELLGRRRHRPGVRRHNPGALLVGRGVPHQCAGHAHAAHLGSGPAA